MKNYLNIVCLAAAPGVAFAHEGIDPGSVVHTVAHWGEAGGLLMAVPVALAVVTVIKRRRVAVKSDESE